ncbi:MAG: alpha-L-fucosidase [Planctomycetota bacterium]|nr:alpha-L-fucosidase [Planctomycetota bacterium]
MKNQPLPTRQVHLDFHTGPAIPDVGSEFDAREFARTFKRAHVNSVTVFAKCHHGHLYYNTKRPERHPGLPTRLDLLGRQIEALHREGIRAPIYLSVQCDEYAANTYPHWIAKNPDGTLVKKPPGARIAGWQILDMSSPYQDFLEEQTREVLATFKPVDGIFFDMCWDQPSVSDWAMAGMTRAHLNPELDVDRATYAQRVSRAYMRRFFRLVKASNRNAGVYFNSRKLDYLAAESAMQGQIEIEALPTGGWGYMYFPRYVRLARTLGKPYLGMTARFHKSWADFGGYKPYAALEYETSQMMAHGAACSIGDQLHPRGKLDEAAYELIGKVYSRVEAREPWLIGAKAITQIGVVQAPGNSLGIEEGATRLLTQLKHQFNFISLESRFEDYELIILPDAIELSPATILKITAYLKQGGAVLATGSSGLSGDGRKVLLPVLGLRPGGCSPFTASYVRFGNEISEGIPQADHVMYDRGYRVKPARGAKALARVVEPYFERAWDRFTSHRQTPPDKLSPYAAAVQKGRAGYICFPVFSSYLHHANPACRWLVERLIDRLLPDRLVQIQAPSSTEVSLMRQGRRTIVHLLQYCPERRTQTLDIVEDIVPLHNVKMSVRFSSTPKRVYLAPERTSLDFGYSQGRVRLVIPRIEGHAMVVLE